MSIKSYKQFIFIILFILILFALVIGSCFFEVFKQSHTNQKEIHVSIHGNDDSGNGTKESPYATVAAAAEEAPGSVILLHEGEYGPVRLGPAYSGSEKLPTIIKSAEGEKVVLHAKDGIGLYLNNVSYITVEGLEIEGGTHGIYYESTQEAIDPLTDIRISDCKVHGVRGTHGICVYARNDLEPVHDLTIENCEVYDCECGSSESMVLNGNIDGFIISGNSVHDNNNIGIDMIGFEGTAIHSDEAGNNNAYEFDMARNGVCSDNVVYNISTKGNKAYYEDGEYDLSAGGIYVDGGQNIDIYNNFIFNCDIGLEVATEHSPDDNKTFKVSGVHVHDNVIADCKGWAGLCFGGYDSDLGFTENCEFDHNTLVDNNVQIGVQRSRENRIHSNLIIGGETAVEFNENCSEKDMVNDISGNVFCEIDDEDSLNNDYGRLYSDRILIADGFRSLIENIGSGFVPGKELEELYNGVNAPHS